MARIYQVNPERNRVCPTCQRAFIGRRIKRRWQIYCSVACVPRSARMAGAQKAKLVWMYRHRARKFRHLVAQLPERCSREDIYELLQQAWEMGRHAYRYAKRKAA